MSSGLSNDDKAKIRQQFATGQVGRDALLEAESAAYHGQGTCTFYGTANSNQNADGSHGFTFAKRCICSPSYAIT